MTKNSKADSVPLHPPLVEEFRKARPESCQSCHFKTRVFPVFPTYKTWPKDFERAGIRRRDQSGKLSDFHTLRVTYCTMLHRQGVPLRQAMAMMRHSDSRLTTNVCTDQRLLDTTGEIVKLPWLDPKGGVDVGKITDTGTDKVIL